MKKDTGLRQSTDKRVACVKKTGSTKKPSNEFYEAVISAIGHAVSVQAPDFRIIYQNSLHKDLKRERTGEYCYEAYSSRSDVCPGCPVALSLSDGMVHTFEKKGFTADSRNIEIEITSVPLKDRAGKITSCVEIVRDITGRKLAEKAARESENKYRSIFDNTGTALIIIEKDTKISLVNSEFEKLSGYSREEIEDKKSWTEFVAEADVERMKQYHALRRTNPDSAPKNYEFRFIARDGTVRDIFITADIVKGTTRSIASLIDITERRKAQEEAIRAGRLASLGELAAGVAHEINNPVNGIISYAELLLDESEKGSSSENIAHQIIEEGERIAYIVKSLLSFARDRKEEKHPVSLQGIMSESLALAGTQIQKDGIILKLDVPPDLPVIIAHPQQIQQVFLNILSNARYALNRKYPKPHKEKKLEISAKKITIEDRPYVRIIFYDTGTGIPAHMLDKVVNPFFTTKPGGIGTGLGLSISHGIITGHGGRFVIESDEGKFTKVIIDLPASPTVHQ